MYRCYTNGYHHGLYGSRYVYKRYALLNLRSVSTGGHRDSIVTEKPDGDNSKHDDEALRVELFDVIDFSNKVLEKTIRSMPRPDTRHDRKRGSTMRESRSFTAHKSHDTNITPKKKAHKDTSFTLSSKRAKHVTVTLEDGIVSEKNGKGKPVVQPPELVHDLNRILYQPVTLHPLRDSRTGIYNFERRLETIAPDYLESKEDGVHFVTPHRDAKLLELAGKFQQKYISSTSSMTSTLSHLHYLLSNFRPLNVIASPISKYFPQKNCSFTQGAQFPSTIILRKKNSKVRSLDSDRSLDREIILSILGHSLEEFLTQKIPDQEETYHYSKIDDFILRSQLDAYDPRLPGTGVFDLKTRAVAAIRHDLSYVEKNNNYTGYEIDKVYGEFESLEREFFELIRSTLLKYSLQARIGKMDGIFVAYHNISRMFGFQYLPLDEIDYIIHSSYSSQFKRALDSRDNNLKQIHGDEKFILDYQRNDRAIAARVADSEFKMSIILLRNILDYIEGKLKMKGIDNWQMCKIMMKTENVTETIPNSDKKVTIPLLRVVILPLPPSYKDKPLLTKGKNKSQILKQITTIREDNEKLIEKQRNSMTGFEIRVDHFYKHHPDTTSLPYFAKRESNVLDPKSCEYVAEKVNENYYRDFKSSKTPNFFHPKDVSTWRSICKFTDIEDKDSLKDLYEKYLDEKLNSLQDQCVIKESLSTPDTTGTIVERINNFMQGKNVEDQKRKESSRSTTNQPSNFQSKLRAYAKKGEVRRKLLDKNNANEISQNKTSLDA